MGKFRSKLKRQNKGKTWSKGHSSTSNPENMKHRIKAKSRFFQPNLSLAPRADETGQKSSLTLEAVLKHDARISYADKSDRPTVNDIAGSLKSFTLDEDDLMSESQLSSAKTFKTFASDYSSCSNKSFKKLLNGFRASSNLHKEMLAILTALTEIIKERGGSQSSTEYFLLLMETIEASKEESETVAGISLLGMGIKSVPVAVLRKKFSETAQTLMELLERFMDSSHPSVLKYIIGCMSVLLRAQDYSTWTYSSNLQYLDILLTFTVHSKPKIRKAAQHAIVSIMHGSSFMIPEKSNEGEENVLNKSAPKKVKFHPAGNRVAKFCLNQFKPEVIANSQTIVLHALGLLRDTLAAFKTEDIKNVCESILSIMTAANVLLRTKCFQTLHTLFLSRTENLNGILCGKLIAAIYEYRPDKSDTRQTLAWLTVLKEGHIHLTALDVHLCVNSLPTFVDILATDLWMSDRHEVVAAVSNTLKEILYECVKPACTSEELAERHKGPISKVINLIAKALSAPFGDVAKYVILTFSIVFEVTGKYFSADLKAPLVSLANRYDTQNALRVQIEHSIISAIKSMGPDKVLNTIPLTNSKGEFILDKSWILPLLREGINGATFEFFANNILPLAAECNKKWCDFKKKDMIASSHTYELLCCQLWGLFPGFCRNPKDPENFRMVAKTLGLALADNPDLRAPILDGFIELIKECGENCKNEISKYAKNFLPRLFNVYATKPNGTYEADIRKKTLEVIKEFLTITPEATLHELFTNAVEQLKSITPTSFEGDALCDIVSLLLVYQKEENLKQFYETFIVPVVKQEKSKIVSKDEQKFKKQQRKAYEHLKEILSDEKKECKKFCRRNSIGMEKLLLEALRTTCLPSQAARLKCLKMLIETRKNISVKDRLVVKTIPEAILSFKDFSNKKENISQELITLIGELYQKAEKLNDFVDIVTAGFSGDPTLITNTIWALRSIVQNFTGNLTVNTLEFILQQIAVFLVQKNRQEAEASVTFLITFTKVLPSPLVANHLETIMKSLSAMVPDTKRYCRIQIGYLLKKLCKRFTAEELIKLVPGNDEVTHRRLKKIRKQLRRENRKKDEQNKEDDDDSEEEFVGGLEKKSVTIDDVLADSDSDSILTDTEKEEKPKSKKGAKKKETFIKEAPEDIVDLADIKAIGNIITNRPSTSHTPKEGGKKNKDPNRGFKTAEDGRLIITDKDVESDSEDEVDEEDVKKSSKRALEEDSSGDEEMPLAPSRKRRAMDSASVTTKKSTKSTATSRYTAGGKGIHRPVAASVKSGYSASSKKSSTSKAFGTEYTSKKAKGDMKKKGKLDPYAYIPLNRNILNKRKRAKNAGQFKSIVTGARKGASKGIKSRVHKKYKK